MDKHNNEMIDSSLLSGEGGSTIIKPFQSTLNDQTELKLFELIFSTNQLLVKKDAASGAHKPYFSIDNDYMDKQYCILAGGYIRDYVSISSIQFQFCEFSENFEHFELFLATFQSIKVLAKFVQLLNISKQNHHL